MKLIDKYLNETAMYYLVVRGLALLAALTIGLGFFKLLPFSPLQLVITFGLLVVTCYFSNLFFRRIFKAKTNYESSLITALILFFILVPVKNLGDIEITVLAGLIAQGSKYILAIKKKHIFNPAAISLVILGFLGFGNEIWWVGSTILLPFVLGMGFLVVRKIRRFSMVLTFLATALATIAVVNPWEIAVQALTSWPVIFFGTVMLTEPSTTPPQRKWQIVYGVIVGVLFGSQFQFGPIYSSPELALIIGNIFSFSISSKQKLFLELARKTELSPNIFEFSFSRQENFAFLPGQYLEWTLPHKNPDARGTRRYFSIASNPAEKEIKIAVRVAKENGSTFKNALLAMNPGDQIVASQLAGDFILQPKPAVLIAGGIGITPFRSMAKSLKDAVLFYAVNDEKDFVYLDYFKNIKVVPVVTPKQGYITEEMLKKEVPDFKDRLFYLSGPNVMVDSYKALIKKIGIPNKNITTDYFPGY